MTFPNGSNKNCVWVVTNKTKRNCWYFKCSVSDENHHLFKYISDFFPIMASVDVIESEVFHWNIQHTLTVIPRCLLTILSYLIQSLFTWSVVNFFFIVSRLSDPGPTFSATLHPCNTKIWTLPVCRSFGLYNYLTISLCGVRCIQLLIWNISSSCYSWYLHCVHNFIFIVSLGHAGPFRPAVVSSTQFVIHSCT